MHLSKQAALGGSLFLSTTVLMYPCLSTATASASDLSSVSLISSLPTLLPIREVGVDHGGGGSDEGDVEKSNEEVISLDVFTVDVTRLPRRSDSSNTDDDDVNGANAPTAPVPGNSSSSIVSHEQSASTSIAVPRSASLSSMCADIGTPIPPSATPPSIYEHRGGGGHSGGGHGSGGRGSGSGGRTSGNNGGVGAAASAASAHARPPAVFTNINLLLEAVWAVVCGKVGQV